jgi:hypothetical protein
VHQGIGDRGFMRTVVCDSGKFETPNPNREMGISTTRCLGHTRGGEGRTCGLGCVLIGIPLGNLKSFFGSSKQMVIE